MNDQMKFVSEKKKEMFLNPNSKIGDNLILLPSTWTSIFLADDMERLSPYLSLFDVSHYYWYICQAWLFVLNTILEKYEVTIDKRSLNRFELLENVHQICLHRVNISNTLLEVRNVDFMLKNSQLSSVMKELYNKFGIEKHLSILQGQMDILFEYYQIEIDTVNQQFAIFSEKQTQSLQILFAISMGAGIASLIPSICNLPDQHASLIDILGPLTIATFSVLFIIWAVYFLIVFLNRHKREKIRKTKKTTPKKMLLKKYKLLSQQH